MLKLFKLRVSWHDGEDLVGITAVVIARSPEDACDYFFKTYKFPSKPQLCIDEYDIEEGLIV